MVVCDCNPSTWEAESQGSQICSLYLNKKFINVFICMYVCSCSDSGCPRGQKMELQAVVSLMWALETDPDRLQEQQVLLTAELSLGILVSRIHRVFTEYTQMPWFTGTDGPSGFGFELTFRLKRETGESAPPTWPAELMQGLARYVFQSENTFCSGDHVSWHSPLDNSESRIQHMLLTEDPQMQPVQTPFGVVTFLQIVGVCTEELHSAQQWNGQGILELLRTVPIAGGPWLITDMRRGETIFEIDPHLQQERVDKGIETDGSNLSGVSAKCAWDDLSRPPEDDEDSRSICLGTQPRRLSGKDTEQIRETLRRGLEINSKPVLPPINSQRQNGLTYDRAPSRKDSLGSDISTAVIPHELIRTRQLESVHLKFNQESGALIPLCLRGRLLHGRHFTYKSITGDMAITFVSTGVEGAFATEEHPYAAHGPWLQILLTEEFVEKMLEDLEDLTSPEEFKLPKEYSWPEKKLKVSILPDVVFDSPLH
eukprot:XP_008758665.1 PREDICTED: suppressor of fused homolog isoform X2 [Rattus norvegicus]